jgi:hypothetical protein
MEEVNDIGCRWWVRPLSGKFSPAGRQLADRHYNRRKVGAPQFMPPGQTLVLITYDGLAVWGWWRPHPASGLKAMNGLDGWTCSLFRNESAYRSSDLILDAERALVLMGHSCGPSGMLTYVDVRKVKGTNPGYCYQCAGWSKIGWSADGHKRLWWKPFTQAGQPLA